MFEKLADLAIHLNKLGHTEQAEKLNKIIQQAEGGLQDRLKQVQEKNNTEYKAQYEQIAKYLQIENLQLSREQLGQKLNQVHDLLGKIPAK